MRWRCCRRSPGASAICVQVVVDAEWPAFLHVDYFDFVEVAGLWICLARGAATSAFLVKEVGFRLRMQGAVRDVKCRGRSVPRAEASQCEQDLLRLWSPPLAPTRMLQAACDQPASILNPNCHTL